MAARGGNKGKRRSAKGRSRKGKARGGSPAAWYQSNWFLLIVAAVVLVGVQLYHQRAVDRGEGSAEAFGEPAADPAGAAEAGRAVEAATPEAPRRPSRVEVDARPAVGSEKGGALGAADGDGLLAMAAAEGELPEAAVAGGASAGVVTIRGRVDYRGMVQDEVVVPTSDRRLCPEHPAGAVVVADGHLVEGLVWVDGAASAAASDRADGPALAVDGCRLAPRAQAFPPGVALRMANADELTHTLVAKDASGEQAFRVELDPGVSEQPVLPTRPGLLHVSCEHHPWETAYLLVHPAAAATDLDGRFSLADVPLPADGAPAIHVFHPELGTYTQRLDLHPGQMLDIDIDLTEPIDP